MLKGKHYRLGPHVDWLVVVEINVCPKWTLFLDLYVQDSIALLSAGLQVSLTVSMRSSC